VKAAVVLACLSIFAVASIPAAQAGDPQLGEVLFRTQCGTCHAIDRPRTVFGPHLVDIYGREAGAVRNFRYSYEMQVSGVVWDEETLDALMANPQAVVPGTIMYYRGLPNEEHRAHIIAYLKQQSGVE
jgi:cytochrome c